MHITGSCFFSKPNVYVEAYVEAHLEDHTAVLWNIGKGRALQLVKWGGGHPLPKPLGASTLAALSGNILYCSLCFTLRVCSSNDVCSQTPGGRCRNQRHRFTAG